MALMETVEVEVDAVPGFVAITFTTDDDRVELALTPDDARGLCNMIGSGILAASRAEVMA
jgi:hypothetical protein